MFGSSKYGFTLLELMITIAVIGFLAMVVGPNLGKKKAGQERTEFLARLSALTRFAWQNALIQNTLHKVVFDYKKKIVSVEQATKQKDAQGKQKFEPIHIAHVDTSLTLPDYLSIKNFFIEGFDEFSRRSGTDTTWFFVVPDGLTQRVTINLADSNDRDDNGRPKKIGLVLNPFNAQFTTYDTFQK